MDSQPFSKGLKFRNFPGKHACSRTRLASDVRVEPPSPFRLLMTCPLPAPLPHLLAPYAARGSGEKDPCVASSTPVQFLQLVFSGLLSYPAICTDWYCLLFVRLFLTSLSGQFRVYKAKVLERSNTFHPFSSSIQQHSLKWRRTVVHRFTQVSRYEQENTMRNYAGVQLNTNTPRLAALYKLIIFLSFQVTKK